MSNEHNTSNETLTDQQLLVTYLSRCEDTCPRCGYSLKMLTGDRCPECGDRLRLQVGLVETRLKAYITSVVGNCLGFGGALFFLILVLCYVPSSYWDSNWTPWILCFQVLVTGLGLLLLLQRRWFTRKTQVGQWSLAIVFWAVTLILSCLALILFQN